MTYIHEGQSPSVFPSHAVARADDVAMSSPQGNLKSTIVISSSDSLPVPSELPGESLHQLQEDQALQHLFQVSEDVTPVRYRTQLFLSFLPVKRWATTKLQMANFDLEKSHSKLI